MDQILATLPWFCLLLVFGGMLALSWKLASGQHDLSTLLAQALAGRPAASLAAPPIPAAHAAAEAALPPAAPAKPAGAFASAPPWFTAALHEIGFHETGANQGIERYISMAHCGALGDPWCAIFACAMLESSSVTSPRSASSQSFRTDPGYVQLTGPALGAIAVFWRISKSSGQGHVGFYRGEDATRVWTLGGNENDMVQIEALPKSSASFGLIGYWWPKSVPLPVIGPVLMPTGSPVSIKTAPADTAKDAQNITGNITARQTGITATMFGGQKSAYGGAIDDNSPGVALPFRFTGERPKVRVTGKSSTVVCDIVDVGPWNTNDPYWQTGTRPQAEAGTDMTGRHTNKAGVDLTLAAAKALQIDGKGLCSWEFVTAPLAEPSTPKVT